MTRQRHWLAALIAVLAAAAPPSRAGSDGALLYLGLASNGWQVFELDLPLSDPAQPRQLTFSDGDKRRPQWHPGLSAILFRDGQSVRTITNGAEIALFEAAGPVLDFALAPDARTLWFTRAASGNQFRHFVWSWRAGARLPSLVARPQLGSYCQPQLDPTGQILAATHFRIETDERLVLFDLKRPAAPVRALTPPGRAVIYPVWSGPDEIIFSEAVSPTNLDLFACQLSSGAIAPLLQTPDSSELCAAARAGAPEIFYEKRTATGDSQLEQLNRSSMTRRAISLPHPAKEPFWRSNP